MNKYHFYIGCLALAFALSSCGMFTQSKKSMNGKTYLALGDSYTIGQSVLESDRFPEQLVNELAKNNVAFQSPEIIARTGWRTDELISAIAQADLKTNYDFVTILIGVNNEFQGESSAEFKKDFMELCETSIRLAGGKKNAVYVLSIPDYGFTPFGRRNQEQISVRINEYNEIVQAVSKSFGIRFIDITAISRKGLKETELVANDGLHPSGKMYAEWVKELLPVILKKD